MKYTGVLQTRLRPQHNLQCLLVRYLAEARRLLSVASTRSAVDLQHLGLLGLLLEANNVLLYCFKTGALSLSFHNLRLAQEIVFKILAFSLKPELAEKAKVTPGEVRKIVDSAGFFNWREFYAHLCEASHHNRDFVTMGYPDIEQELPIGDIRVLFTEYHLVILAVLNMRALNVIYIRLRDAMGSDYRVLVRRHRRLEARIDREWNQVHQKVSHFFDEWKR